MSEVERDEPDELSSACERAPHPTWQVPGLPEVTYGIDVDLRVVRRDGGGAWTVVTGAVERVEDRPTRTRRRWTGSCDAARWSPAPEPETDVLRPTVVHPEPGRTRPPSGVAPDGTCGHQTPVNGSELR